MVCSRYPRECRYYETVLKRKSLRKLKHNVWENKVRWKLYHAADAHHREKLLRKYLNAWILFLKESLRKRINVRVADSIYEYKLKKKGISCLRRNAEMERVMVLMWKKKAEWNAKRRVWDMWKHYTQKRLKLKEIDVLAKEIREERLLVRFFYLWLFRYKEKISLEAALEKASTQYDRKLKKKAFASWKVFKDKKICKKQIQRFSTFCYEDKLTERVFRGWKKYTNQKSLYRNRIQIMDNFYQSHLVKCYLDLWFVAYQKLTAEKDARNLALAVDHYRKKSLERGFEGFVRMKEMKRAEKEKVNEFNEIHVKAHLSFYLELWVKRRTEKLIWNDLEATAKEWREYYLRELLLAKLSAKLKEKVEEKEEMEKVIIYSNAIITHRAFKAWEEAMTKKLGKKLKAQTATQFYFDKLTKKTFERWKVFTALKIQKAAATAYYRNRLLAKTTTAWISFVEQRKATLMMVKNFEHKYELKLLRQSFQDWKKATAETQNLTTLALAFCNKSKLFKVFAAWRSHVRNKSVDKLRYKNNRDILNDVRIKSVLSRWLTMMTAKQNVRKKVEEVRGKQNKRALSLYFNIWRNLMEKMKNIRQTVAFFPQLHSTLLLEEYMEMMCRRLRDKRIFKRKEDMARRTEEKLLKRRCLRRWVSFVCWKKEKLRFLSEEKKYENSCRSVGVSLPSVRSSRRKPIIPDYLKEEFRFDQFSETSFPINEETFAIEEPVNKKLPVIGQKNTFVSFEV